MQKQWGAGLVFAAVLAFCPAVAAEEVSGKLLKEAKDKVAHLERLISAAKEGDAESQYQLSEMIRREGRKQVRDQWSSNQKRDPEALKASLSEVNAAELEWMLRAAWQGHEVAQWRLAKLYENKGDHVTAYAWNRLLFRKHKRDSISSRNGVEKPVGKWLHDKMTADQVTEAIELSHQLDREIQRRSNTGNQ